MTETYTLIDATNDLVGMLQIEERMAAELDHHRQAIKEHRQDILAMMTSNGVDKVTAGSATVSRRKGTRVTIVNQDELAAALRERGLYETCLADPRLDLTKAKRIAEMSEMPGVERVPYDELSVRVKP